MKTGKLSLVEKAAIQTWVGEGKTTEKIAKSLDRTEKIVDSYIKGELDELLSSIATAKMPQSREQDLSELYPVADKKTIGKVFRKLKEAGLNDNDSFKVVRMALEFAVDNGMKFKGAKAVDGLYSQAINQMKAGEFMVKKAEGGQEGVAIMTPAASQRSDKPISQPKASRKMRGEGHDQTIFRPYG